MKLLPVVFAAASVFLVGSAFADEGMWTFDNFPSAAVREKYGVGIDKAWLDRVQRAAVRLSSGCSASIVTADALVLTNNHCVRDCAQALSSAGQDYVQDGFSATTRTQERLCPGMQAEVLTGITDDTAAITAAVQGKTGEGFVKARDAQIAAIEKAGCEGRESQYRCQVITLYEGGQYKLYTYRKYSDVRLVFAPEQQTAFFGGDPDNFNFPRYDLDFSIVRLYENGQPVRTPDHLSWRTTPPRDGEPVFVAGNPGSTDRLLTAAQLTFIRDVTLPTTLLLYSELRGRLIRFGEESAEHARTGDRLLFGLENSFKALSGEEKALTDPTLIAAKRRMDASLQLQVRKRPALSKQIGDPWARIVQAQQTRKALYLPYTFIEARAGLGSDLFGYARALVRAAAERTRPNGERLREFTDARLPLLQKSVLDDHPVYPQLEQLALEFWLSKLREYLTVDDPRTKIFLGKDSPEELSANLAKSGLGNAALRKKLWEGGEAAIRASEDPMIRFVLATDGASRAVRTDYESRVVGPVDMATEQIAHARFAIYGTSVYPDATFSLRLSYGKVGGWTDDGRTIGPFTRYKGLWQRATGQPPFALAPRWVNSAGKVDPDMVFDFVTDNDIIGGNSGSPAIDAQGHVIGAIFDGNIESLGGDFGFDEKVNRAVAVSTAAITEALEKIYGNAALVADLKSP
ncbi:MAG TPA: S46 family peptidase [Steroidobacteraceae bacterium]